MSNDCNAGGSFGSLAESSATSALLRVVTLAAGFNSTSRNVASAEALPKVTDNDWLRSRTRASELFASFVATGSQPFGIFTSRRPFKPSLKPLSTSY